MTWYILTLPFSLQNHQLDEQIFHMAFLLGRAMAKSETGRLILGDVTNVQKVGKSEYEKPTKKTSTPISDLRDYEKITTIKHVTSFRKAKSIFSCRHLKQENATAPSFTDTNENSVKDKRKTVPGLCFLPVVSLHGDTSRERGNVRFSFKTLNGPKGIWTSGCEEHQHSVHNADGHLISPRQDLRYFLIHSDESNIRQILISRRHYDDFPDYNPCDTTGPWRVVRNPTSNEYEHFVLRKTPLEGEYGVEFLLDDSVFSVNSDHRVHFSENLQVGFTECSTSNPNSFVDSHPVCGPLRLTLAASCYRWPGGIHLTTSDQFDSDRAIKRFEAYHARLSREVLVSCDHSDPQLNMDDHAVRQETVKHWVHSFRQCKYAPTREMCERLSDIVVNIRVYLEEMSKACGQSHNTSELRHTLQAFVLFLAANCLDRCTDSDKGQTTALWEFDTLYKFVLNLMPDARCHHVFRDCIIRRLVKALDGE